MNTKITLYTSTACPNCRAVKRILARLAQNEHLRYDEIVEERNIDTDRDAKADLMMMNLLATPTIECGEMILTGDDVMIADNLAILIAGNAKRGETSR